MATQLKNIVSFVGVAPAATVVLPHGLNINDMAVVPDALWPSTAGFVMVADDTNITVTNNNAGVTSIDVLAEHWHTLERDFGAVQTTDLVPQPFVGSSGAAGGVSSIQVQDEGVSTGVPRPTLNFTGSAVTAVDDAINNRVNIDVTAASVGATVPTQIDVGDAGSAGVSTEASRADHQHALPAPAAPADVTKSAASAGVATTVARADHKHDVSTAVPVAASGAVNAEGAATSLARSDHLHRTLIQGLDEGAVIASRPALNFIGAGVTVADNGGADRLDITIPGGGGGSTDQLVRSGVTTTGLADGDFGYISGVNTVSKTDADALASSRTVGANEGTVGSMTIDGMVENAKFTTAGGSPSNGAAVYLAPGTEEAGAAGKLTATAPSGSGQVVAEVGIVFDNSNYAGLKTCTILLQVKAVEVLA